VKNWNFKVILAGDGAVGKTSIRERYMGKGFTGQYLKTIGADFASKKVQKGDNNITFQIWDLAGQESYSAVRSAFYKGAAAGLFVFDVQDPNTMSNLRKWIHEAIESSENSILVYFIIANKIDLVDKRKVSREMALEFCHRLDVETGIHFYYCETSALTGQNIQETFDLLAYKLLEANNEKLDVEYTLPDGIIDVREVMAAKVPVGENYVSVEEFNELKNKIEALNTRVETLSKKVETLQVIVKKLIEKMK